MSVAIHEKNLVTLRCKRFEQKHPEVRHKVVGDFIIRIVEQNIHTNSAALETSLGFFTPALPSGPLLKYVRSAAYAGGGIGMDTALFIAWINQVRWVKIALLHSE